MSDNEILLTTIQAAQFLNRPARALEAARYRGEGPRYVRLSRSCVRYRKSDLIAWLDARTVTPADRAAAVA